MGEFTWASILSMQTTYIQIDQQIRLKFDKYYLLFSMHPRGMDWVNVINNSPMVENLNALI